MQFPHGDLCAVRTGWINISLRLRTYKFYRINFLLMSCYISGQTSELQPRGFSVATLGKLIARIRTNKRISINKHCKWHLLRRLHSITFTDDFARIMKPLEPNVFQDHICLRFERQLSQITFFRTNCWLYLRKETRTNQHKLISKCLI